MEINKNFNGGELTVCLTGRLDTTTAPELEAALNGEIEKSSKIILDFANLEYVSSAGLRVILMVQKQMSAKSGQLVIKKVSDDIMEVFDMTGFSSFLTIED